MEIKITKPKTAQVNYRKRRDMSSESIGTTSAGLFAPDNHKTSANNYEYLEYIDKSLKSLKNRVAGG